MQNREFIFFVHRLARIRLRATRYGATRTSPYLGSDTPRVGRSRIVERTAATNMNPPE